MFIDLAVLLALFLASQFLVIQLEKANHRFAYDKVTQLNGSGAKSISKAHTATSAAKKKASANVSCDKPNPSAANDKAYCDAKDQEKKLNDQLTHYESILAPISNLISGAYFLISLLLLIIPSLFGGATLPEAVARAYQAKEPVVFLAWEPHPVPTTSAPSSWKACRRSARAGPDMAQSCRGRGDRGVHRLDLAQSEHAGAARPLRQDARSH